MRLRFSVLGLGLIRGKDLGFTMGSRWELDFLKGRGFRAQGSSKAQGPRLCVSALRDETFLNLLPGLGNFDPGVHVIL